jgi:hypothetical protein
MKVKLNIARLSLAERFARCRQIIAAMTGNPNFPTPNPPLAAITAAVNDAEAAANAAQAVRQDAKAKTIIQNDKDDFASGLMNQLAAYVESIAGGDESIIRSAGMDTKAVGSAPTSIPAPPENLNTTTGDRDGEIDLSWEAVPGSKSYVIEQSADPPTDTSWGHASVSTRSSYTIDGLKSGARYWFRVAAINGVGQSGWSDPSMKIAP